MINTVEPESNRSGLGQPRYRCVSISNNHFSELRVNELNFKTERTSIYANYTRFIPIHQLLLDRGPETYLYKCLCAFSHGVMPAVLYSV